MTGLDELAAAGSGRARLGKHISDHLDEYLSACQVGVTGAWPAVGIAGEPAIATLIEPLFGWLRERAEPAFHVLSFTTAFAPITYLHVVVGERAPKYFAIQRPLPTILWAAPPLHVFSRLMRPFVAVVNASANRILRGFGITRGTSSTPAARKS